MTVKRVRLLSPSLLAPGDVRLVARVFRGLRHVSFRILMRNASF